jgi:hypothetical protein
VADQLEEVRAFDWVTPSQHKNGDLQSRNLIDQMFALFRTEFHWIAIRLRRRAAMDAGKVAGLSDFPNGDEWTFIEIDRVDLRGH